jgi:aryl-phospho-beta-D-glucosidase BglC (GH1 family)
VNQAALGWGASALPGIAGTNFPLISNASIDYFAAKGMNTIRVSIIWERLQPTLYGDFDWTYANYLVHSTRLMVGGRILTWPSLCRSTA